MKSLLFMFLLVGGCGVVLGLTREYIYVGLYYRWNEAQWYCRQTYRDLATITTIEENNQLLQLVKVYSEYYGSWIGLTAASGTWTWSDGEQTSFFNWYGDYYKNSGACASTFTYEGLWTKYWCTDGKSFYCYRFLVLVNETKTWEEAQQYCRTYYTDLASVTSELSLKQLKLETVGTQTESVWTGLRSVNGIWLWVSRESLGSLVSMPSCPASSYRCGALDTTTNTLKNHNCNDKLNFVCYWT